MKQQAPGPVETPAPSSAQSLFQSPDYAAEVARYQGIENRIINFVAGVAPWLAPLIPAYFAAYNAYQYLTKGHSWFDAGMVAVISLVVETVGLVGVHTALQFWNWNRIKRKTDGEAPLILPILAVFMYVAIVILVNGLLDWANYFHPEYLNEVKVIVTALLSLLSLNSALIVALRAGQNDRVAKAVIDSRERKFGIAAKRAEKQVVAGNFPETFRQPSGSDTKDWRHLSHPDRVRIAGMTPKQVEVAYEVSERTARNWKSNAEQYVQSQADEPAEKLAVSEETAAAD